MGERIAADGNKGGHVNVRLSFDRDALADLCRRHHIRRLALFGSTLKGTARADSDIDLLVEFAHGKEPGLIRLAGIEASFSALFGGRRVDLRTAQDLSEHFRAEVPRSALVQYAA
jgi:predicted nucleotidyltransferase